MQIKGFLAGLGVAGKLALGVGVAAAATTGAGAAGVLPGPVQHAMSKAVGDVTPFSMPDPAHHGSNDGTLAGGERHHDHHGRSRHHDQRAQGIARRHR